MTSTTETRREAHEAIQPAKPTYQAQVYSFIAGRGNYGATDEEIQNGLNLNPSTQRPRRVELWDKELITHRGFRPTRSGRRATVWVVNKTGSAH